MSGRATRQRDRALGEYAEASRTFSELLALEPTSKVALRGLQEAAKGYQLASMGKARARGGAS